MSAAAARAVAQYLADCGVATAASDLFRDWMPEDPDELVSVMGMGGVPSYAMLGGAGSVVGQVQIQVRAAKTDYIVAEQRSYSVMAALDWLDSYKPPPPVDEWVTEILTVTVTAVPHLMERDGHERPVFLAVYDVVFLPPPPPPGAVL